LPQHRRGAGAGANGDPRRRRQLRDPQTSQGTRHPRWTFHFTPTSASWLNAVEGFFAKLTRRRLKRGVFRSVADLQGAINRFVEETNSDPKPFVWTADAKRVLAAVKRGKEKLESIHYNILFRGFHFDIRHTQYTPKSLHCDGIFAHGSGTGLFNALY